MIKLYGEKINHFKSGWFQFTALCGVNNIITARLPAAPVLRVRRESFALSNVAQPRLGQELQEQLWGIILSFD